MGVSLKRIVVTVLAVLAMTFLLIDAKYGALSYPVLISIITVVYLGLVLVLGCARRGDMMGAGGQLGIECALGILLLLIEISTLESKNSGLTIAGLIMNIIVGALFLVFAMF